MCIFTLGREQLLLCCLYQFTEQWLHLCLRIACVQGIISVLRGKTEIFQIHSCGEMLFLTEDVSEQRSGCCYAALDWKAAWSQPINRNNAYRISYLKNTLSFAPAFFVTLVGKVSNFSTSTIRSDSHCQSSHQVSSCRYADRIACSQTWVHKLIQCFIEIEEIGRCPVKCSYQIEIFKVDPCNCLMQISLCENFLFWPKIHGNRFAQIE